MRSVAFEIARCKEPNDNVTLLRRAVAAMVQRQLQRFQGVPPAHGPNGG
jgi:hypothetical protein